MTPEQILRPSRPALVALREGVATEQQWATLASAVETALAIDSRGVVRGMRGHLMLAEQALAGIRLRAMDSGTWCATALYLQEIDDVTEALRLHEYQLERMGATRIARALRAIAPRVHHQAGGYAGLARLQRQFA